MERIKWLDIAKGIAIISVVIGHTITRQDQKLLWCFIYSFHMPLFFLVSGYLFKEKPIKQFLKHSGKRLLLPYFITAGIFIAYKVLTSNNAFKTLWTQIKTYLYASGKGTEFIKDIVNTGAIWFLAALFVAGFIFNIVLKIKDQRLQFWTIVSLTVLGYSLRFIKYLPWNFDIALVCQTYLYIGFYAKRSSMDISSLPIKALPLIVFPWVVCMHNGGLSLVSRFYNDIAIMFVGSLCGCIVIIYLSNIIGRIHYLSNFLTYCGKESLVILCIHFLEKSIIPWPELLHYKASSIPTLTLIILIALKLLLYLLVVLLLKKIPLNQIKSSLATFKIFPVNADRLFASQPRPK